MTPTRKALNAAAGYKRLFESFGLVPKGYRLRYERAGDGSGVGLRLVAPDGRSNLVTFEDRVGAENTWEVIPEFRGASLPSMYKMGIWSQMAIRSQARMWIAEAKEAM